MVNFNLRFSPAFYIIPKNTGAGLDQSLFKHLFHSAHQLGGILIGRSQSMIFMQLTTQLIHYHILICIIICYKPKGNIVLLYNLSKPDNYVFIISHCRHPPPPLKKKKKNQHHHCTAFCKIVYFLHFPCIFH